MSLTLMLAAVAGAVLSALICVAWRGRHRTGQRVGAAVCVAACIVGLTGALTGLSAPGNPSLVLAWPAMGGNIAWRLDPLSAFFAAPVFVIGGLGALYGTAYWDQKKHPASAPWLGFFWGMLVAGMALVVLAGDALAFLLGWELMALSAFFLIGAEHRRDRGSHRAALIYLLSTHGATLALFAAFALLRVGSGSFEFRPDALGAADPILREAVAGLLLFAFSIKAGLMPFHFWLPDAHAHAPSHVSALM